MSRAGKGEGKMKTGKQMEVREWATRIMREANDYADYYDPQRTGKNEAAHAIDALFIAARKIGETNITMRTVRGVSRVSP